jgi:hypothetical protein
MVEADMQNSPERFYLDDLHVGQRFTSRTHVIDAAHIIEQSSQDAPKPCGASPPVSDPG